MEASKCPKCGDEPHYVEQVEKWYCYGCNSYVEDECHEPHDDHEKAQTKDEKASEISEELKSLEVELPTCKKCGATLEKAKDESVACPVCEAPPDKPIVQIAPGASTQAKANEAQALIDSITVAPPVEPVHEPIAPPATEVKKERPAEIKMCPACGQPMKYIEKYQRYYCYGCRKYAPRDSPDKLPPPQKPKLVSPRKCPGCGRELRYVEKYSEYYCHTCKKYPLKSMKKTDDPNCPKCGSRLRYVEQYSRYYCLACKEYAPKGYGHAASEKKACPACHEQMKYVPEYNEWYCYKCKRYSLRPNKPALLI